MTEQTWPWIKAYPQGLSWNDPVPERPVYEMLYDTVRAAGTRTAFDFLGKTWTWNELGASVDRLATGLQRHGVGKGVKVGLFLPNSYYFIVSYYAVLRAGGTVVNFNPLYVPKELHHQIEDSETDIMITLDLKLLMDKMQPMLQSTRLKKIVVCPFAAMLSFPKGPILKLLNRLPLPEAKRAKLCKGIEFAQFTCSDSIWCYEDLVDNDGRPAPVAINPQEDIAVLQYTGGTTGTPKGAMLTHANVTANAEQAAMWLGGDRTGKDKMLGVIPFFHVFAMTAVMNLSVRCGFEIIALPRFDLEDTLKVIHKKRPTYFPAVPAIYNAINNYPHLKNFDLTSLKYCIAGGAPLPVEVKKAFEANTGCVVTEGYGLTESTPVVCVNPAVGENKPGSIGLPLPGTIVEIIHPDDKSTPVPLGEKGELCVRGPQVMKGYHNKPEETAAVLKGGRLHTGDIATMDKDGYFYIVDRIKDLIITNGYNVYPRNVEEAIYLHEAVEECIVAGMPDESRGEIVKAWIKPKAGKSLTSDEMKTFLKDKLSSIEMPRQIEIREKPLPKTMIGKLSRKDLLIEEKEKAKSGGV